MAKCKFCSAEIPDDSLFCTECGGKNPVDNTQAAETKKDSLEGPKKKKKGLVIGIVAGIVALVLIVGGVLLFVFRDEIFNKDNTPAGDEETTEEDEDNNKDKEKEEETSSSAINNNQEKPDEPEEPAITLGDSIYDGTIEIEGVVYQFPCSIDTFLDNGWVACEDIDTMTVGGLNSEYVWLEYEADSSKSIEINIFNFDVNAQSASDCDCIMVRIVNEGMSFKLPGNIDESFDENDLVAAYGEPDEKEEATDTSVGYLSYFDGNLDIYTNYITNCNPGEYYVEFSTDLADYDVQYGRIVIPADFNPVVSSTAPAYLLNYNAPVERGEDASSGNIEIDGVVYNLPCPVSAFTDNGWSAEYNDDFLSGYGYSYANLTKGDYQITVWLAELSGDAALPENCVVTDVSVEEYSHGDVPVSLTNGIAIGYVFNDPYGLFEEYNDGDYVCYSCTTEVFNVSVYVDSDNVVTDISIICYEPYVNSFAGMG